MRNFPGRELGSSVFGLGITNGFGFRGRSREKAQLFSADTSGIQRRVPLVAQTIAKKDVKERIVTAMVGSGQFPRDTATHIIDGEQGRILGLGKAYWPFFYGLPLSLLDKSHHHVKSIFEKGPSLDAHLGVLDRRLQPKRSEAVDFSHIARGATEFIDIMQRQGLLRRLGKYHVRTEQEIPQSYHADLSISILEAQYDKPFDLARQLFQHSDTVLVGDVLHGRISLPLAAPVTIGDKVKFTTVTQPGKPTGFQLELLGEAGIHEDPAQQYTRRYYTYRIQTDHQLIREGSFIKQVDVGASQKGVCTVFVDRRTGTESLQAWTFRPKVGASAADLGKVFAAEETLHDLYEQTQDWDGNGALGMLSELGAAAVGRRNLPVETVVVSMVPSAEEMSGRLPLTILARNKEQLIHRAQQGQLSHIGEGKTYATVDEFLAMIQADLMKPSFSGRAHIDEITTFDPPPLLDIISSRKPGVIRDILNQVEQTR